MLRSRLERACLGNAYILSLKRFGFNVERKRIAEERSLETLMRNVSSAKFGRLLVLNKSEINSLKIIKCIIYLTLYFYTTYKT